MNVRELVIELYTELFKQCSLNQNFVMIQSDDYDKMIEKFVIWFEKKYEKHQRTSNLLIMFFEFQFSRHSGTYSTKYGKNKIMLSWIIGKKAIKAWEDRTNREKFLVRYELKREVKLRLSKTYASRAKQERAARSRVMLLEKDTSTEDVYKKRFHNTPQGFVYCMQFTTCYDGVSRYCLSCTNKGDCISYLKDQLPLIAKHRNLEHVKTNEEK